MSRTLIRMFLWAAVGLSYFTVAPGASAATEEYAVYYRPSAESSWKRFLETQDRYKAAAVAAELTDAGYLATVGSAKFAPPSPVVYRPPVTKTVEVVTRYSPPQNYWWYVYYPNPAPYGWWGFSNSWWFWFR